MKLKKSLGQHFLVNGALAERITALLETNTQSVIIEIGCGAGALTQHLVTLPFKEFHIIELDDYWSAEAYHNYCKKKSSVLLHHKSILDFDCSLLHENNISMIGNIPYNITYDIINYIIDNHQYIDHIVLMMQEEVARKLYKQQGKDYGPISVLTQLLFDVTLQFQVAPNNFNPPPKVMSRIISLKRKNMVLENKQTLSKFLKIIFKHPRKTIKNNIQSTHLQAVITQDEILQKRAQQYTPQELYNLFLESKNHAKI